MRKQNKTPPLQPKSFCVVREAVIQYRGQSLRIRSALLTPQDAIALAKKRVHDHSKEHLLAIYLDGTHRPIAFSLVFIGTANSAPANPREIFQPAVALGAVSLIVLHNHPSGESKPSSCDDQVTKTLAEAGRLLGIKLLDHIVWTVSGDFYSYADSASHLLR